MRDLYRVLGVPRDASADEIRAAYVELRRDDESDTPWGESRVADVEYAYAVLSDPARRAAYDAANGPVTAGRPAADGGGAAAPMPAPSVRTWPAPDAYGEPRLRPRPAGRRRHSWNPVDRLTAGLPRPWRVVADWVVTIAGAIAIVLAIKAWVVNPYRIPSSSMEPTLHCARPGNGCVARFSDRVLANRFIYHFRKPQRGDVIVFETPKLATQRCGAGGTFVKRLVGLPGETWEERNGYVFINGKRLAEPYVKRDRRDTRTLPPRTIPPGRYFMMGDNRLQSCDSREWGPVPRENLIGEVFGTYWPPNRIGFVGAALAGVAAVGVAGRRRQPL